MLSVAVRCDFKSFSLFYLSALLKALSTHPDMHSVSGSVSLAVAHWDPFPNIHFIAHFKLMLTQSDKWFPPNVLFVFFFVFSLRDLNHMRFISNSQAVLSV